MNAVPPEFSSTTTSCCCKQQIDVQAPNLSGDAAPDRVIVNPSGAAGTGSGVIGYTAGGATVLPKFVPGSLDNTGPVSTFTSSALAYAGAAYANFNEPSLAFSSSPRVIQVLARF